MKKVFSGIDNLTVLLWLETAILIVAISLAFILPIKIL